MDEHRCRICGEGSVDVMEITRFGDTTRHVMVVCPNGCESRYRKPTDTLLPRAPRGS